MDILEAMMTRKSSRSFTDEALSREELEQLLTTASRAPSAINMQPWEVHVVSGEERKMLSRRLLRSLKERQITCAPGSSRPLPEHFIERGRECATGMTPLIEEMGSDFKTYINEGSLNFYGAYSVVLIFVDDAFPAERMIDVGTFTAYLVLAAEAYGLATCPIGLVTAYEDDIKDHLNVADSKKLALSIALGRRNPSAAINEFKAPRAGVNEFVRWID